MKGVRLPATVVASTAVLSPALATSAPNGPTVSIDRIAGMPVTPNGRTPEVTGGLLTASGTSGAPASRPPLSVDAVDSRFVRGGDVVPLTGMASHGSGRYRFSWSTTEGSLRDAETPTPSLDTAGLTSGTVEVQVDVVDQATGDAASDTVQLAVWDEPETLQVLRASEPVVVAVADDTVSPRAYGVEIPAGAHRVDVLFGLEPGRERLRSVPERPTGGLSGL
jgi:hypothetical protein